jgi:prepilin-type N-terminal cleavage/methylation domain-containing protein
MKKGFTLIELACVVVIVTILAGLILGAAQKVLHGKNFKTIKGFYTLTKDASESDITEMDLSIPLEKVESTNLVSATNIVKSTTNMSDYVVTKMEQTSNGMVITFFMNKPYNSFRSFTTVSQNVVRIEFAK